MKERDHWTPDVCAGATANGQIVQVYVDHNHPLLQRKRALPWAALWARLSGTWLHMKRTTTSVIHARNCPRCCTARDSLLARACRVTEVGGIGQRFQPKEHQVLVLG